MTVDGSAIRPRERQEHQSRSCKSSDGASTSNGSPSADWRGAQTQGRAASHSDDADDENGIGHNAVRESDDVVPDWDVCDEMDRFKRVPALLATHDGRGWTPLDTPPRSPVLETFG
jgi:hypothetical protein